MNVNLNRAFAQRVLVNLFVLKYGDENDSKPLGTTVLNGRFGNRPVAKEVTVSLEDGKVKVRAWPVVDTDSTPNYIVTVLRAIPKDDVVDAMIDLKQMDSEAALEVICPDELTREEIIGRLLLGLNEVLGFSNEIPVELPTSEGDLYESTG